MDVQRLRNLTTGRLHTEIGFVYEDIEHLTGVKGIMTHMMPRAMRALMQLRALAEMRPDGIWDGD